jgi:hypothetical protein
MSTIQESLISAAEQVKTTVAPIIQKGLEKVIETVEKIDADSAKRDRVYGAAATDPQTVDADKDAKYDADQDTNQDKIEEIKLDDGQVVDVIDAGTVQTQA